MTDNFNLFKTYISGGFSNCQLDGNDSYYVVELIRRGKDNKELPAANVHFKNYYIRCVEDLSKYEDEIKQLCTIFKMRAYISVNVKSFKQVTLNTLAELARRVANGDFKKSYNVYESCSGKYYHRLNKRWIIDIDDTDMNHDLMNKVESVLNNVKPLDKNKIIMKLSTKSGIHFITRPFDLKSFNKLMDTKMDVKKNHLTLLYENL
jgi:hypothetical protein